MDRALKTIGKEWRVKKRWNKSPCSPEKYSILCIFRYNIFTDIIYLVLQFESLQQWLNETFIEMADQCF